MALTSPLGRVVALGMHRSATSAVAELLGRNGLDLGSHELLPGNEYNPHGYFENLHVVEANDEALEGLGGSWCAPPDPDLVTRSVGELVPVIHELWNGLRDGYDGVPLLKDPRIALLLPVWTRVLGPGALYVLCVRNPLAVARSLLHRNGMPLVVGLALWEAYNVACLRELVGRQVLTVDVDAVLQDRTCRVAMVDDVRGAVGLAPVTELDDTVEPALAGGGGAREDLGRVVSPSQLALYDRLGKQADLGVGPLSPAGRLRVSPHARDLLAAYAPVAAAAEDLKALDRRLWTAERQQEAADVELRRLRASNRRQLDQIAGLLQRVVDLAPQE